MLSLLHREQSISSTFVSFTSYFFDPLAFSGDSASCRQGRVCSFGTKDINLGFDRQTENAQEKVDSRFNATNMNSGNQC